MRFLLSARLAALFVVMWCLAPGRAAAAPITFTVNSPADIPDATPGNAVCETALGNGVCTLRGAIQEANAHAGADTISLQGGVTYLLTRVGVDDTSLSGDLDVTDSVAIVGAGPSTIIDGNGDVVGERVFQISKCIGNVADMSGNCSLGNLIASMSGVTIQHGKSANIGGGIVNNGSLTIVNSAVVNNRVAGLNDWGGGIYNSGPLAIINSSISGNTTGSSNAYGGGMYNQGPLTITDSTISANTTTGNGGGIFTVGSTTTVTNTTIRGNTGQTGGGIHKAGSPLIVINSTITGNYSTANGGGIYGSAGTTSLFNVTITDNQANSDISGSGTGGGVASTGGTVTFANSIIALNTNITAGPILNDDDCSGTLTSQGNNILYFYNSFYCTVVGPVTLAYPYLGPLQDNGGPTQMHALLAGSPAINAGNSGGCTDNLGGPLTKDQRGRPRPLPYGGRCDIGAYEHSAFTDDPLFAGSSVVRAVHVTELRARIDGQRVRFGLPAFGWTDPSLAGVTVTAVHVSQLRTALLQAYTNAAKPPPSFADSPLVQYSTLVRMIHIQELRDAVIFLEGS